MWPAINIIYCIFFLTKVTETDAEIKILLSTKCILCSRIISTNYTFSINDSTDYTFLSKIYMFFEVNLKQTIMSRSSSQIHPKQNVYYVVELSV